MPDGAVPLSVIVATRQGWPAIRPCIEAVLPQVRDVGGELIVVDASGLDAPDLGAPVRWLSQPTTRSVFQLRQTAYGETRGEVVAQTEDHCRVAAGWCEWTLRRHREHPEAIALGGAVDNGTREHLVDWAAFFITQIPFAAPLVNGPADRITGAANLSYKRAALERMPDHGSFGAIELFDSLTIRRDGEVLLLDDSHPVLHDQSLGFGPTSTIEFHNGRTIAGLRHRQMAGRDWLRIAAFSGLPAFRSIRTVRIAWTKRVSKATLVASIPLIVWLQYCSWAGEMLGYATGSGQSPRRLR